MSSECGGFPARWNGVFLATLAVLIAAGGCAVAPKRLQADGAVSPPREASLEQIFLSLPTHMAADMTPAGRRIFLEREAEHPDATRFDSANGLIGYFSDSEDGTGATSMLYVKVLPTSKGGYIVLIHMPKAYAGTRAPSAGDTYILRPSDSGWADVTAELLPPGVSREWYFLPRRTSMIIETGPNVEAARHDGRGVYWKQVRKYDLRWDGIRFQVKPAASEEFTYE